MKFFDTIVNSEGWVDVEQWTSRAINTIPLEIRDPDSPITHCATIVAITGDPTTDPPSGGVAGSYILAKIYEVSEPHFIRNILPKLGYIRWWGPIPVTHISSAYADADAYRTYVKEIYCNNLGITTGCSSAEICL